MNDATLDLNSGKFDFSADSRIKESLLAGLLSKRAEESRAPVSFQDLLNGERGGTPSSTGETYRREPDVPPPDKGRGK